MPWPIGGISTMKHSIIIFPLILSSCWAILACRSSKSYREQARLQQEANSRTERASESVVWHSTDSQQAKWWLQTDSPFFFHPDIGLWGRGGQLRGLLVSSQGEALTVVQDSMTHTTQEKSHLDYLTSGVRKTENHRGLAFYGVMALLLVVILYRLWRKR